MSARFAPLTTLVVWLWVLLPTLLSLSADNTAVAVMVVGPGPRARQYRVRSRTSVPLGPRVPRLHATTVADCSPQFALAGLADTKVAPAGTVNVNWVFSDASAVLLSTRMP